LAVIPLDVAVAPESAVGGHTHKQLDPCLSETSGRPLRSRRFSPTRPSRGLPVLQREAHSRRRAHTQVHRFRPGWWI